MARTTQGYDVLIELSRGMLNRGLGVLYDAGIIPDHWTPAPGQDIPVAGLQIFLLKPFAEWGQGKAGGTSIVLRQGFVIRTDGLDGEIEGVWSVPLPVDLVVREVDGQPLQFLRCDCSTVSIDDITLTGDDLGFAALILLAELHKIIVGQIGEIPLSAALPGGTVRLSLSKFPKQNFLTVFANLDGRAGPFVEPVVALVPQDAGMSRPDVAVAIDESVYMPRLKAAMAAAGLTKGRKFVVNKMIDEGVFFDNVLRSFTLTKNIGLTIQQGAIKVTGAVTADISNAPDVDAKFTLKFGLSLNGNKVAITVLSADVDVDSIVAAIVATAVAGPIGLVVEQVIEEAAGSAIEDAVKGQSAGFALPVQTVFVDGIPITTAKASDAETVVFVRPVSVSIRTDSLLFGVNFDYQFAAVPHVTPIYYRGHRQNLEFHVGGCSFGDAIKMKNLVLFPTPRAAFAEGYDGCKQCLPQFNGDGTGELSVTYVRDPGAAAGTVPTLELTYLGKYTYAKFTKSSTAPGTVTKTASGKASVGWKRDLMAPGAWSATVVDGATTVNRTIGVKGGQGNSAKIPTK